MDELTRQLYGVEPDRFMAARAEAVAAAATPAQAKEIAKLRKPTVGAWLVNLLAIEKPELIRELADLSASLRTAQRELRGAELRELAQRRRTLVATLLAQVSALGEAAKPGAKLPLFEVETTLNAALSDEETAKIVQSGRLTKTVSYAGLGELPVAGVPQLEPATEDPSTQERQEALAEARAASKTAQEDLAEAERAEQDATAELDELDDELARLRDQRASLSEELSRRRHSLRFAQRAVTAANRRIYELDNGG
jgi:hypothetical protein